MDACSNLLNKFPTGYGLKVKRGLRIRPLFPIVTRTDCRPSPDNNLTLSQSAIRVNRRFRPSHRHRNYSRRSATPAGSESDCSATRMSRAQTAEKAVPSARSRQVRASVAMQARLISPIS